MNTLNCCLRARLVVDTGKWLVAVGNLTPLRTRQLQLLRCPRCDALWYRQEVLAGHREHGLTLGRAGSQDDFDDLVATLQQEESLELKAPATKDGESEFDWKTGRKLNDSA
ncbi:MAG: hypothetical protein EOO25_02875 [Comamonadaceae bacterium]|nr:MAG: hypothetical protein EOO25_02875 [Comamonadaceae bacterium]